MIMKEMQMNQHINSVLLNCFGILVATVHVSIFFFNFSITFFHAWIKQRSFKNNFRALQSGISIM